MPPLYVVATLAFFLTSAFAFNAWKSSFQHQTQHQLTMKGPVYPTKIKNVITALTKSTQKALQARKSRIEIELPPAVEWGVESDKKKGNAGDKVKSSNREAARLLTEMFAIIGPTTTVLFPSESEASTARSIWGGKFKGQTLSIDVPAPKGYGKLRSRRFTAQEQEAALMASDGIFVPDETEVLIIAVRLLISITLN